MKPWTQSGLLCHRKETEPEEYLLLNLLKLNNRGCLIIIKRPICGFLLAKPLIDGHMVIIYGGKRLYHYNEDNIFI